VGCAVGQLPEQIERPIEPPEIVMSMDEERLERGTDVSAVPDANPVERAGRIDDAAGVHVEAGPSQGVGEHQEVGGQRAFAHD
jgi:hypothetical protein